MPTDYISYFLNARRSVVLYETLEISHPNFTKVYRLVRNKIDGLTATLETSEVVTFDYLPLRVARNATRDNLDFGFRVTLGDLGKILAKERPAVMAADGFDIRPTVMYRAFRSDDLAGGPKAVHRLEMPALASTRGGAAFDARAPQLASNKAGEYYALERFETLRGVT